MDTRFSSSVRECEIYELLSEAQWLWSVMSSDLILLLNDVVSIEIMLASINRAINEYGPFFGMRSDRRISSFRTKLASVPLCSSQIPHTI